MRRRHLSNKERKELIEEVKNRFNFFLDRKDKKEILENDFKLILINGEVYFFFFENKLVPSLKLILKNNFLKKVVIDQPAVKFIIKGADVLRPGIVELGDFDKDEIISIVDERNRKPLAIGLALFSSEETKKMEKGKVIKNLHHIRDKIWGFGF